MYQGRTVHTVMKQAISAFTFNWALDSHTIHNNNTPQCLFCVVFCHSEHLINFLFCWQKKHHGHHPRKRWDATHARNLCGTEPDHLWEASGRFGRLWGVYPDDSLESINKNPSGTTKGHWVCVCVWPVCYATHTHTPNHLHWSASPVLLTGLEKSLVADS